LIEAEAVKIGQDLLGIDLGSGFEFSNTRWVSLLELGTDRLQVALQVGHVVFLAEASLAQFECINDIVNGRLIDIVDDGLFLFSASLTITSSRIGTNVDFESGLLSLLKRQSMDSAFRQTRPLSLGSYAAGNFVDDSVNFLHGEGVTDQLVV
jgi:hypothetical protein